MKHHHRPYRTVEQARANENAWLAMVWGAAQPMLPEGYAVDRRIGERGGEFDGRMCFRLTQVTPTNRILLGEFATKTEAIEAAIAAKDDEPYHGECWHCDRPLTAAEREYQPHAFELLCDCCRDNAYYSREA